MSIILINKNTCKKCGICQQACPVSLIEKSVEDSFPIIAQTKEAFCINCGHCEAICPEASLTHQLAENAMKPMVEGHEVIPARNLGNYFRNRRSIRNYQSKKVDKKIFEEVMDVVRYAPTGTNRQLNQWVIVSDDKVIEKLIEGTILWMQMVLQMNPTMGNQYNFPAIISSYQNGVDRICRNAPHIVIAYGPKAHAIGALDTVIATSHLELLLPSYGLGACWAGFLMLALQNSSEMRVLVGLDESIKVHSALMVGYPKFGYFMAPPRKGADVKWM